MAETLSVNKKNALNFSNEDSQPVGQYDIYASFRQYARKYTVNRSPKSIFFVY